MYGIKKVSSCQEYANCNITAYKYINVAACCWPFPTLSAVVGACQAKPGCNWLAMPAKVKPGTYVTVISECSYGWPEPGKFPAAGSTLTIILPLAGA